VAGGKYRSQVKTFRMTDKTKGNRTKEDFVKQSSLYQEFLAEREEILKYKWIESERLGYDIGFERALLDWIRKHRDDWRESRRRSTRRHLPAGVEQKST